MSGTITEAKVLTLSQSEVLGVGNISVSGTYTTGGIHSTVPAPVDRRYHHMAVQPLGGLLPAWDAATGKLRIFGWGQDGATTGRLFELPDGSQVTVTFPFFGLRTS